MTERDYTVPELGDPETDETDTGLDIDGPPADLTHDDQETDQ